jgi:hypothetical protein
LVSRPPPPRVALPTSRELNKNTQLENVAMSSN